VIVIVVVAQFILELEKMIISSSLVDPAVGIKLQIRGLRILSASLLKQSIVPQWQPLLAIMVPLPQNGKVSATITPHPRSPWTPPREVAVMVEGVVQTGMVDWVRKALPLSGCALMLKCYSWRKYWKANLMAPTVEVVQGHLS
jgi:hypothetical protein